MIIDDSQAINLRAEMEQMTPVCPVCASQVVPHINKTPWGARVTLLHCNLSDHTDRVHFNVKDIAGIFFVFRRWFAHWAVQRKDNCDESELIQDGGD